jgi:hypothetical protein
MQLSFIHAKFPIKTEFWTQLDADSGRSGHLGRDDSGILHFSDYAVTRHVDYFEWFVTLRWPAPSIVERSHPSR